MTLARPDRAFFLIAAASALADVSLPHDSALCGRWYQLFKIARPFVESIGSSPEEQRLASAILRLGATLGLDTVAEGIEERRQVDLLRRLRCRYGQGFHFSPPLQPHEIDAFLERPLVA